MELATTNDGLLILIPEDEADKMLIATGKITFEIRKEIIMDQEIDVLGKIQR